LFATKFPRLSTFRASILNYISIPVVLVETMELKKGEEQEWILEKKSFAFTKMQKKPVFFINAGRYKFQ